VQALAARGACVAVLDRRLGAARDVAAQVQGQAYQVDVAQEQTLRDALSLIEHDLGLPVVLVNSAALFQRPTTALDHDIADYDRLIAVNQRGSFLSCLVFGGGMVERGRGSIVNIASIAGMRSLPLHAYNPSKAAVIAMTENLAGDWGPAGVRVNAVSPGFTLTENLAGAIDRGERDPSRLTRYTALQRLVSPGEVAALVAFLASPEASAITGVNIPVDCGWLVGGSWETYGGFGKQGT
jgi:NAD(P)-dependent dehydrogenase (short-subunit alcohol dehydrogenase family)